MVAPRRLGIGARLFVAAFLVVACGPASSSADPSAAVRMDLTGTAWTLIKIDGAISPAGPAVTLRFEGDRVAGEGPCNGFGGAVSLDMASGGIEISDLVATKRACVDPARSALETAYFAGLRGAASGLVDGGRAYLTVTGSGPELGFEPFR